MVRGRPATVLTMRENKWRLGTQGPIFIKSFGWQEGAGCFVSVILMPAARSWVRCRLWGLRPTLSPQGPLVMTERVEPSECGTQR